MPLHDMLKKCTGSADRDMRYRGLSGLFFNKAVTCLFCHKGQLLWLSMYVVSGVSAGSLMWTL